MHRRGTAEWREFASEDQSRRASGRDGGRDPLPRSRARPHGGAPFDAGGHRSRQRWAVNALRRETAPDIDVRIEHLFTTRKRPRTVAILPLTPLARLAPLENDGNGVEFIPFLYLAQRRDGLRI